MSPSILDLTINPNVVQLKIRFSIEAMLAEINLSEISDTNLSENADKYDEFNSSQHTVYPKTGWLILFPANLLHVVLPSKEERHSIVYDIGVK